MKSLILITFIIVLVSCGGGGGGSSSSPTIPDGSSSTGTSQSTGSTSAGSNTSTTTTSSSTTTTTSTYNPNLPTSGAITLSGNFDSDKLAYEESSEYTEQYGLALIKASAAYARGATGRGSIIGIMDSGVDTCLLYTSPSPRD